METLVYAKTRSVVGGLTKLDFVILVTNFLNADYCDRRSRSVGVRLSVCLSVTQLHVCPLSINQSRIFRVVHVIKSRLDPLKVGNDLTGIDDNVRKLGLG